MTDPKRHHTISRVYLENFHDDDGRLSVYSKRRNTNLRPKPKDALVRSFYYSQPLDGIENAEHGIETKLLNELETQYPELYDQLVKDKAVNLDLMYQTLLMMRSRSPAFREAFELGLADYVDKFRAGIPRALRGGSGKLNV